MKLSTDALRRLLTKEEFDFISGLAPGRIEKVAPQQLRQKLGRARRLRDKYRDLAKRQARQARGKAERRGARPAQGNANTLRKVQVFDWAMARITERLEARGVEPVESPAPKRRPKPAPATIEEVQPRVVELLKEHDTLSFGDLWSMLPDIPATLLRKTLWSLSEVGAIDLSDGAGVALSTESEVAEDVDVEVVIDRPSTRSRRAARRPGAAREGKPGTGPAVHHPRTRIHSHLRSATRRDQTRRDRRR